MPRLLLIDDEPDLLHALTVRLTIAGFNCQIAKTGREGMEQIRRQPPDLIISDLLMPDLNGYELCQQLQADTRTASIPIIILTAVPKQAVDRKGKLVGKVKLMHKPFDSAILLSTVQEVLAEESS